MILILNNDIKNLCGGIENENFSRFLYICFSRAEFFSLSKTVTEGTVPNTVETMLNKMLNKYIDKTLEPKMWFGYPHIYQRIVQTIYKANDDTLSILNDYYQDIFLINRKKVPKAKIDTIGKTVKHASVLEDLCFWRGKSMFLGTLSHEYICATGQIDEELVKDLCQVASWSVENTPRFGIDRVRI
ncbi:MAG: hypothetical protein ACI3VB_07890 [Oscillospiraceae bacterium]